MNYFELFQIPVSLKADKSALKSKFYELSRNFHPDFFAQSSFDDQANALEQSSQLNTALKVLQNQDERIKYVLQLKGLLFDDEKYQLPPDFLMEVMEINEALEEQRAGSGIPPLEGVKKAIDHLQQEIYAPVKTIVENYSEADTSTEELLQVKHYYFQKKYLDRILAAT